VADKSEIVKAYTAIKQLYRDKKIDENVFYKMAATVAYDFMVIDDIEACVCVLNGIPATYFEQAFTEQLQQDPEFERVALALAKAIHERKIVLGVRPTQKPAQA
jgi:inosine/xanthosine triphosphate pyrophosphatase family protein